MEVILSSETSVHIRTKWRYIPEDGSILIPRMFLEFVFWRYGRFEVRSISKYELMSSLGSVSGHVGVFGKEVTRDGTQTFSNLITLL
jgi:hypothetical protein